VAIDDRRLNSGQVLAAGILGIAPPKTRCPDPGALVGVDEEDLREETLLAGLNAGGLDAPMYYGCWRIWKTATGFSGELMQYRAMTDQFADAAIEFALQKAQEWGAACYG